MHCGVRRRLGRGLLIGVVGAAVAVLVPATPAGAKTEVSVKGDDVTITVPIDCAGCNGKTGPGGVPLADYWAKTAQDAWNAAFANYPYCSRYLFHLKVDIRARDADFKGKKGDALLQVINPSPDALQGTGWEGAHEHNASGLPGQRSPDGTRYYENDADGTMASNATPTVIDHEMGHMLGLGDDRTAAGVALPGRDGTLMIGGAVQSDGTATTQNSQLRIDNALIDRIGQQLEKLGKIDKCKKQSWQGTLRVDETVRRTPVAPCTNSYTADVTVTVKGKETTDTASIRPGGSNSCGPPATVATVALPTQRTGGGFAIDAGQLTYGAPGTTEVKKSGRDQAHGTLTTTYPLPNGRDITYDLNIDLHCTDCGKAVG